MNIRLARSLNDLKSVWRLTHDVYVLEGYATPLPDGMLRHYPHLDLIPQTSVLLIEDEFGQLIGTNSLTLDSPAGLVADEDFPDVTEEIRCECGLKNKNLGCSWRLVTHPDYRDHLAIVLALIDATVQVGIRYGLDVTLYTLNPKHESFYQRMLGLVTIAGPMPGLSVRNAPALLMYGYTEKVLGSWQYVMGRRKSAQMAQVAQVMI